MLPVGFWYTALFVFGAAVGSYLNVVTMRYQPTGWLFSFADTRGRSHCPHCKKVLAWYELVPLVSFLAQGGRCRSCGAKLSLQYPVIELATAVLFAAVPASLAAFYRIPGETLAAGGAPWWFYAVAAIWLLAFILFIVLVIIDLKHYLIPDGLNLTLFILGALLVAVLASVRSDLLGLRLSLLGPYAVAFPVFSSVLLNHLAGSAGAALFFWLLSRFRHGQAMGMGDVKLAAAAGMLFGWPDIALVVGAAFIVGGAVGIALVLRRAKHMSDRLPFGPFFAVGAALTFFLAGPLVAGYLSLIGFS